MTEKRLAPGDPAPEFTVLDADGKEVSLSSFRGQRVIVYFYPAAMTPGCTPRSAPSRYRYKRPAPRWPQRAWRNGIRGRFRSCWWRHRGGSNPPARTEITDLLAP